MDMISIAWLGLVIVLAVIELATMGLTTIWFAGGAVAGFLASILGAGPVVQVALFFAVSVLLLVFTRPFAAKYINRGHVNTNVDAIPGKTAVVLEEISNLRGRGRVLLEGNEWMARTENEYEIIEKDALVHVIRVSGAKLIVKAEKEEV